MFLLPVWLPHVPEYSLSRFVASVSPYGLPTGFITALDGHYSFGMGSNRTDTTFNTLYLNEDSWRVSYEIKPTVVSSIASIYHEATHAYIDMQMDLEDADVAAVIQAAEAYYKDAPLEKGAGISTVNDEGRVAQEAMAEYVAHRAQTYWSALVNINFCARREDVSTQDISEIVTTYDKEMLRRAFGYQYDSRFGRLGRIMTSSTVDTTRPISSSLKGFCDTTLLEGKIADQFMKSPFLPTFLRARLPEALLDRVIRKP